ncbi:hypothetical protein IFR05_002074 [Cadophora sp. M221]|nr:hypothetical protein IFR05_002074 [Cadophora sp. M221]
MAIDRFNKVQDLTPRRFHISENPPFGIGFVIFGHENENIDEDGLERFFLQQEIIRNCKPGIWTSRSRKLEYVQENAGDCDREAILYWVAEGTIDMTQSVEDWKAYEEATLQADSAVRDSQILPIGTKWKRYGTFFSDAGYCAAVSAEYLTHDAARAIMFGSDDSTEELDFGYYLETLSLNGVEIGMPEDRERFTIGGVNFSQDEVGGPPRIAIAEENGQVIAVRFYCGMEDWSAHGSEDGLSSDEVEESEFEDEEEPSVK